MHLESNIPSAQVFFDDLSRSEFDGEEGLVVESLSEENVEAVKALIKHSIGGPISYVGPNVMRQVGRLESILKTYSKEGTSFLVVKDAKREKYIGAAGLGPLAGLPASEGVGEIRELVLDSFHRGRGIATKLLKVCLKRASSMGYKRIYLKTTPQMVNAHRMFQRFGFRPVTHAPTDGRQGAEGGSLPCYFLWEA